MKTMKEKRVGACSPISFDPSYCFLKIQKFIGILTPKAGVHLECVGSFLHILLHSRECECDSWVALLTHTFPCPCLGCELKARVVTQINILTPNFSFGHDLCFKYSNESCKFILDIYILKVFQWYKKVFNPMNLTFQTTL